MPAHFQGVCTLIHCWVPSHERDLVPYPSFKLIACHQAFKPLAVQYSPPQFVHIMTSLDPPIRLSRCQKHTPSYGVPQLPGSIGISTMLAKKSNPLSGHHSDPPPLLRRFHWKEPCTRIRAVAPEYGPV